jgi:hypothetical protein
MRQLDRLQPKPPMKHALNRVAAGVVGLFLLAALPLKATPVTVQEVGMGANEIVNITSSTLGTANVYAGVVDLLVSGTPKAGFCIDPWHWSVSGILTYDLVPLMGAPKSPGPMDAATAVKIEQLWQQYYSPASNTQSAGLQIAIWELVDISVTTASFQLNGTNDYGAGDMIAWVNSHTDAPAANLVAVTGPGQDYAISVPDGGWTVSLLGMALLGLSLIRRRVRMV